MQSASGAETTVFIDDAFGVRLAAPDDYLHLEYARAVNDVGALKLVLPRTFNSELLRLDGRIEVWRQLGGGAAMLDTGTTWLIRRITPRLTEAGERQLEVLAFSASELLTRRVVAYAAASSYASKTAAADNLLKAIWRENFTATAVNASRDGYSASDTTADISALVTCEADLSLAPSLAKGFARRQVLPLMQELASQAAEAGTPLYFDIVAPTPSTLEFRTFTTARGLDHRSPSGAAGPVVLSPEMGNLSAVERPYDYADELTVAFAAGQGQEDARAIKYANDSVRIARSPLNRREGIAIALNVSAATSLQAEADAALWAGRPRRSFSARLLDTPMARYGVQWGWGDLVTCQFEGESIDCQIDAVRVVVERGVETVSASLRTRDA